MFDADIIMEKIFEIFGVFVFVLTTIVILFLIYKFIEKTGWKSGKEKTKEN